MIPLKGIVNDSVMTPINETSPWENISQDDDISFNLGTEDKNDY